MNPVELRKNLIAQCRQVVVKAGTRLLTDRGHIARLVDGIAELRQRGFQVLLVTSGAVGMGMKELNLSRRPRQLAQVQALAAIGQGKLMAIYEEEFRRYNIVTSQLLLTAEDLRSRRRYLNVSNCINALWENDVLPIVNENDSVSIDELKFGDNDILSAMLATLTRSHLTIILTTEQGLRTRENGVLGERISVVPKIDQKCFDMATGTDNAEFSIGGMTSKLRAAAMLTGAGEYLWIADGRVDKILSQVADGEDVGTVFIPEKPQMHSRKRWIRFFSKCQGIITVDDGAADAIALKGKSLLPSGMVKVEGDFKRGDAVRIVNQHGDPIARGLVNFDSECCQKLCGKHSNQIAETLGRDADAEVVHRDNLTLK